MIASLDSTEWTADEDEKEKKKTNEHDLYVEPRALSDLTLVFSFAGDDVPDFRPRGTAQGPRSSGPRRCRGSPAG